jgi:hypothetical protein
LADNNRQDPQRPPKSLGRFNRPSALVLLKYFSLFNRTFKPGLHTATHPSCLYLRPFGIVPNLSARFRAGMGRKQKTKARSNYGTACHQRGDFR